MAVVIFGHTESILIHFNGDESIYGDGFPCQPAGVGPFKE